MEPPLAPRARRRSEGVCVRLSLSEPRGGGGWVAELREGDGWAEGWVDIDLETVTTSCSYLFSGRAEQECVCAPAPVRTSIPGRQGTNMATPHPPPQVLAVFAASHPSCVFTHWACTTGEGVGENVILPTPFSDTVVTRVEGRQERPLGRVVLPWEVGVQPRKV